MRLAASLAFLVLASCQTQSGVTTGSGLPLPPEPSDGSDFILPASGWNLVWSDEFEGAFLDRSKWEVEESCWGGGNDERQCYVDWPETVQLANGQLRLIGYRQTVSGPQYPHEWEGGRGETVQQSYVSGKVRTRGLADWTYGRFAARMRLPSGQGTWPAFWMLPADNTYGPWAASGEIDIMEAVNLGEVCDECPFDEGENRSSGALHFGGEWPDNTHDVNFAPLPGGPGAADRFHVFAVEWGEGQIDWYVDDNQIFSMSAEDWYSGNADPDAFPNAPFDQPFYLMLNLAVGGGLSEDNNRGGFDPDSFPAELLVDWVRVYQCEEDPETGRACMQGDE